LPRFPTKITLFTLPAIAVLHSSKSLPWPGTQATGWAARNVGTILQSRPYTLAARASPALSKGYPHIAFADPMFQLCSNRHAGTEVTAPGMNGKTSVK
jgi:hypothetical protein